MKNFKTTTYQHAFEWAEAERARLGCEAKPVNIVGPEYPMPPDNGNLYTLYNNGRDITLLRTDLPEGRVKYERITNFDELRFKSYPVVKCLMQAGVRLCDVAEGRSEGFYIKEVYAL